MRRLFATCYEFVITLPDRLYPFAQEVEEKWVRGSRAYDRALEDAFAKYGPGRFGYKLSVYRHSFHFLGSILFIVLATTVSHSLFGSDVALYVLLGAAILALSVQEFYLHPRKYGQLTRKGIGDWLSWVLPMGLFVFFFL